MSFSIAFTTSHPRWFWPCNSWPAATRSLASEIHHHDSRNKFPDIASEPSAPLVKLEYYGNFTSFFPLQLPPPILDDFGRVIADQDQLDNWPARCGMAMALEKISPILPQDQLLPLFHFYVQKGLRDRSPEVRSHMRTAALAAINVHGKVCTI